MDPATIGDKKGATTMCRLLFALVIICVLCGPSPKARGEDKSLSWQAIDVTARLDADGRLHVAERQEIVFTGDWNGGERTFRIRGGQQLDFQRLTRIDPKTGIARELARGNLDEVDHYDWGGGESVRWRSRLPSDPPFENTTLIYVLEYTLSNILVRKEGSFLLDHDFAFPDRSWPILTFTLDLRFDPAWEVQDPSPIRLTRGRVDPGEGVVLTIPLRYTRAGRPAGVEFGAPDATRSILSLLLFGGLGILTACFFFREWNRGRFTPLRPVAEITRPWLEERLLSLPPEVVGDLWDNRTGAPEVAAILARMVAEKKLVSSVERIRIFLWFKKDVLHLELLVDRDTLSGYEAELVDAFFRSGETTTDSDRIRERYRTTGFEPAARIRDALEKKATSLVRGSGTKPKYLWVPTALLFLAAIALLASACVNRPHEAWIAAAGFGIGLAGYLIANGFACGYHRLITRPLLRCIAFLAITGALAVSLDQLFLQGSGPESTLLLTGLTLYLLSLMVSVFNRARTMDEREMVGLRKDLAAARRFMKKELSRSVPRLDDSWYPYLIALGLGSSMDRWFRAYGGASADSGSHAGFASTGSGGGSASWSGGGGTFGGAGASASWAAAAGSLASGVAKPSSSGSGSSGGGGGGGSSGGGGGGGW
jgi:uncharacterized membrane protein YgcG